MKRTTCAQIGEEVYASRKYIKGMIERISTTHIKADNRSIWEKTVAVDRQINKDINVFQDYIV